MAKSIQCDSRTKLLPKNLERLLFLKYNLRALSYRTELCAPPSDFIPPNNVMYDGAEEIDMGQDHEEEPFQLPEEDLELVDIY